MTTDIFRVQRLPHYGSLPLPAYETAGAAGMDLRAAINESIAVEPLGVQVIPCGICVEIPEGYVGEVRGRSGLAFRHQLSVLHGVGTIDSDYRGEILVPLYNHHWHPRPDGVWYNVKPGERIAQLVLVPIWKPRLIVESQELSRTERGEQGFGSTGQ